LPTFKDFKKGFTDYSSETLQDFEVLPEFENLLTMLSVLGFTPIDETTILEKITSQPLEHYFADDTNVYYQKIHADYANQFASIRFFEKEFFYILTQYEIHNHKITSLEKSYYFKETLKAFNKEKKAIDLNYTDNMVFHMVESEFFKKHPIAEQPIDYFSPPTLSKATLPTLNLCVPDIYKINAKEFHNELVQVNRLYFYINSSNEDPLEWKAAFIVARFIKQNPVYLASEVFTLKDFNKVYLDTEAEELSYSILLIRQKPLEKLS